MTFLVDHQLPPALAKFLRSQGHAAQHVRELGLQQVNDSVIWRHAADNKVVVVSKDEDFYFLATAPGNTAMSQKPTPSFLDDATRLLVQHFGIDRVRAALGKVSNDTVKASQSKECRAPHKANHQANPSVAISLEQVRQKDEEKHRLLMAFYTQLKDRKVLPESQDIRQFAQIIGLKEIPGKSRSDLVPKLMRFLLDQPTERLQVDIQRAGSVSEQQHQQGFSVLTDKLMGEK